MAPWLIENGGDGVVPPIADRKFAAAASDRKEEAVTMMVLARRMMELGLESRGAPAMDINSVKIHTCLALKVALNSLL